MKLSFKHAVDILVDIATPDQIDRLAKDAISETKSQTDAVRLLEKKFAVLTERHDLLWCNIASPLIAQIIINGAKK